MKNTTSPQETSPDIRFGAVRAAEDPRHLGSAALVLNPGEPVHATLMEHYRRTVEGVAAHRRELEQSQPGTVGALLSRVYGALDSQRQIAEEAPSNDRRAQTARQQVESLTWEAHILEALGPERDATSAATFLQEANGRFSEGGPHLHTWPEPSRTHPDGAPRTGHQILMDQIAIAQASERLVVKLADAATPSQ